MENELHKTAQSFYQDGDRPVARYVSSTTVCEEALEYGRWIGLYWSASGHVHRENVVNKYPGLDSLSRPLQAFELEIDGQTLGNQWELVSTATRDGARAGTQESVVELKHQVRPVSVKVVTRLDGTPMLVRYLEITNTGTSPSALSSISPWSGVLWNYPLCKHSRRLIPNPAFDERSTAQFQLGYLVDEYGGLEGNFVWQDLPSENFRIERKALGRSWGPPYYILKNQMTGELAFLGLAWSANFYAEFSCRASERASEEDLLSFKIGPLAPSPLRVIAPGETIRSPEVHLGIMHSGLDAAIRQWHAHMRCSVIPARPPGKEMFTIAGRIVEEPGEWILREIDIAAEMGIEAFLVDAGWNGGSWPSWWGVYRGDWQEGCWLPGGFAHIRQYLHDKHMLFGIWHEAEAISHESELYKNHPDWVLKNGDGRTLSDVRLLGETMTLAPPDARTHFEETVINIFKNFQPDIYKLDYNVYVGEGGQQLRDGFTESEFWRHYEALYATYDRVLQEFPEAILENCAGGGGRHDLGMLSRFHMAAESDFSVFPYSILAINAFSLFIPPESIVYYHNHMNQAHLSADIDTHLRVTLFAVPIYVGFGAQSADRSTAYFQQAKRYIALHKGFCRPILASHPDVYHHTPDIGLFSKTEWCVLEYGMPDKSAGYTGVFRLSDPQGEGKGTYTLHPGGIDPGRNYEITLDNKHLTFTVSGYELMEKGLTIRLDGVLVSELVMYRVVE